MIRVRLRLGSPVLEAGVRALLAQDALISVNESVLDEDADEAENVIEITSSRVFLAGPSEGGAPLGVIVLGSEDAVAASLRSSNLPWGRLPMDASADELCAAVRAVAAGLIAAPQSLLRDPEETDFAPGPLTEREVEVLGLLSRGLANKQIAVQLGISEHTVKFHVSSIYARLNVSNRTEAVREGLRNGWIAL